MKIDVYIYVITNEILYIPVVLIIKKIVNILCKTQ